MINIFGAFNQDFSFASGWDLCCAAISLTMFSSLIPLIPIGGGFVIINST